MQYSAGVRSLFVHMGVGTQPGVQTPTRLAWVTVVVPFGFRFTTSVESHSHKNTYLCTVPSRQLRYQTSLVPSRKIWLLLKEQLLAPGVGGTFTHRV